MKKSLMDFKDAKGYLKISRATLYRLLHNGRIPAAKVGGQWRFRKERLDRWIEEQENKNNI